MKHVILTLLSITWALFAGARTISPDFDTTRVFQQTYSVSGAEILEINSQYGSVNIQTWDEPSVSVKAVVAVSSSDPLRARNLIQQISIRERTFGSKIQLETLVPSGSLINWALRSGLRIEYEISAPANLALEISHRYGVVTLGDRLANVNLHLEQAQFSAGALDGRANRLKISGGKAEIFRIEGGDVFFSTGALDIREAGELTLNASTGRVTIGNVRQLDLNGSLGEVRADTVGHIRGVYSTGKLSIGLLYYSADLTGKFASRIEVATVMPGISSVTIHSEFSSVSVGIDPKTAIDLEAKMENGEITAYLENQEVRRAYLSSRIEIARTLPEEAARRAEPLAPVRISGKFGSIRIHQ